MSEQVATTMNMLTPTDPKNKPKKKSRKPTRAGQSQKTTGLAKKVSVASLFKHLTSPRSESVIVSSSKATPSLSLLSEEPRQHSSAITEDDHLFPAIPSTTETTIRNGRRTTRSRAKKATNSNGTTIPAIGKETTKAGKSRNTEPEVKAISWCGPETEELEEAINYSTNPNSSCTTPSPSSPAGSLSNGSSGGGGGGRNGGSISATRRNFTLEFKQSVLEAFTTDPECIGNQRATARKFNIHRRQVQKWLQQLADDKEQQSDEQRDLEDEESSPIAANPISKHLRKALLQPSHSLPVHVPQTSALYQNTPEPPSEARTAPTKTNMIRNRGKGRGGNTNGRTPPQSRRPTSHSHSLSAPPVSILTSTPSAFASNRNLSSKDLVSTSSASRLMAPSININTNPLLLNHFNMPLSSSGSLNINNNNTEHSRHSPRISPPSMTNGNQSFRSPSNSSGGGLDLSCNPSLVPLFLVDELCEMYPHEDFSLLRKALSKNSVSLTKLPPPRRIHVNTLHCSDPLPSGRSPNSTSPSDYMTQQTLQIIKQQNEYMKLLQQSGINLPGFPSDISSSLGGMSDQGPNLPWYHHSLAHVAAAAAVGLQIPGFNTNGNGNNHSNSSGSSTGSANGRKVSEHESHIFLSPKPPGSNGKIRTVAAALAATRENQSPIKKTPPTRPRTAAERKGIVNTKPCTITRPPEDDYMDPSSMLEINTSYHNEGIDLTTTASSTYNYNNNMTTTTANVISKGRNKASKNRNEEVHSPINNHNNGPFRISGEPHSFDPTLSSTLTVTPTPIFPTNGHSLHLTSATAGLESFVQSVLPSKKSPPDSNSNSNGSESECSKDMVLNAFNYDPEVKGDARGVARKFKISFRNVTKWIRENSSKLPLNGGSANHWENSVLSLTQTNGTNSNESNEDSNNSSGSSESKPMPSVLQTHNKRKNSKPNHICDMEEDHAVNVPLNMVVPIKKRRVSTPTPFSN